MQGERQRARPCRGVEHADAVRSAGVRDEPPLIWRAGSGQPFDEAGQHVVGNGEQHQVGSAEHACRVGKHGAREIVPDPPLGLLGNRRSRDYLMPGTCQRQREGSAHAARPDYPDPQPGRMFTSSSLHEYRTAPLLRRPTP